jgi:hypothetical protein
MPLSRCLPPKPSQSRLFEALDTVADVKARHGRWLRFVPATSGRGRLLFPHPVYSVRLSRLLAAKPLSTTLKRVAWMYFLRDRRGGLACGEVTIVSGRHKSGRLSEGPFVATAFRQIEQANRDPRISRRRHELRSVRVESMHLFCLWIKGGPETEYFIPVTSSSAALKAGEWITRRQFTVALRAEARRIRVAQRRMSRLLKARYS